MDDIKLAMLGNKEAAKRLTEAGVLLPCQFCGGKGRWAALFDDWVECVDCGARGPLCETEYRARLAWNTRTPILSAEEMEMLEGME